MMVLLIVLGSVLAYLVAGQVAVRAGAKAIAEKNTKDSAVMVYWKRDRNYGDKNDDLWLPVGRTPAYSSLYTKGHTIGSSGEKELDTNGFKKDINRMRWLWFVMIPTLFVNYDTAQMIEKYDPSAVKRREAERDKRMAAMEARTKQLEQDNERLRREQEDDFDNLIESATTTKKRRNR